MEKEEKVLEVEVVEELPEKAQELAVMVASGLRFADAVAACKVDPLTAARWVQRPEFESLVSSHLPSDKQIRQAFMAEASRNVEALRELRDRCSDPKVQIMAVKELLAQAGFVPVRKVATISYSLPKERHKQAMETVAELLEEQG